MLTFDDKVGRGVENPQKPAYVIHGCSLTISTKLIIDYACINLRIRDYSKQTLLRTEIITLSSKRMLVLDVLYKARGKRRNFQNRDGGNGRGAEGEGVSPPRFCQIS